MSGKRMVGRPLIHGGFSTRPPGEFLKGRARRRLREYLTKFRSQIVEEVAGSEEGLTAAQVVLVDRATAKLTLARMVELYITETGPFEEPGKLRPVLDKYLTFTRELRLDLLALGIERRKVEEALPLPWEVTEEEESEGHSQSGA